jgi:predicted DNA-binding helix-hairpin-helix protein
LFLKSIIATFDAGIMDENVLNKLKILAESAKYDVSCSSSGTVRSGKAGMLGNTVGGWGICHSFAEDGRCISLLKVMLTNYCIYDCAYCINRRSNDLPRATLSVTELVDLTMEFYRRNYIEGLFLHYSLDRECHPYIFSKAGYASEPLARKL